MISEDTKIWAIKNQAALVFNGKRLVFRNSIGEERCPDE